MLWCILIGIVFWTVMGWSRFYQEGQSLEGLGTVKSSLESWVYTLVTWSFHENTLLWLTFMSSLLFLLFFLQHLFFYYLKGTFFFFTDKQWIASLGASVSFCSSLYWYNSCVLFCTDACSFWLVIKKITLSCSGVISKWKHFNCYHWWAMNFLN